MNEVLQDQGNNGKSPFKSDDSKREHTDSCEVFLNSRDGCSGVRQKGFSSEELCGWRGWWGLSLSRWTPAGHYQGKTLLKGRKLNDTK